MTPPDPQNTPMPGSTSAHLRELGDDLRNALSAKRLIFTVTTGRSGTDFLRSIMSVLPGVSSKHEPSPNFVDVFRRVQLGVEPDLARRWLVEEKLRRIARKSAPIYFEASHVFCKGFVEPLVELGFVPRLILLSRDNRDVARSMFRLGTIPSRLLRADRWYLRPDDPGVLPMDGWQQMHDYQLCYWYTLEIGRRQDHYENWIAERGGATLRVRLAELMTAEGFERLSRFVTDAPPSMRTRMRFKRRAKRRENTKSRVKESRLMRLPDDLDTLEREVHDAIERASRVSGESPTMEPDPCPK